jgi:drug/metabolite transporter (DMT)-like permease
VILGLLCAVIASVCYGAASVLQATGARRTATAQNLDPRLFVRLLGQLPYVLGLSLDLIGFVVSVVALQLKQPLFVVQAIVAGNVGVTAAIVAFLGTRLTRNEWMSIGALVLGLVLLALSAGPEKDVVLAEKWFWVMLAAAVPVAVLGAIGLRLKSSGAAVVLGSSAGLGFAITAVASRTLVFPDPWWKVIYSPAVWAIAAGGVIAMLVFGLALQRVPVTTVMAFVVITETLVPSAIGLAVLGDTIRTGFVPSAVAGLVLALLGAALLARFGEVHLDPAPEMAPGPGGAGSGGGRDSGDDAAQIETGR